MKILFEMCVTDVDNVFLNIMERANAHAERT